MTDLRRWLQACQPAPPSTLTERLGAAAEPESQEPRALARAAFELLGRVAEQPGGGRELAGDLLAADAFVTYAFEAQAERDVDGLESLADFVCREGDSA